MLFNIIEQRKADVPRSGRTDLTGLWIASYELKSSNPRDRIYGLLNPCGLRPHTIVDYNRSKTQVYIDAAKVYLLIDGSRALERLLMRASLFPLGATSLSMPSWVPDWREVRTGRFVPCALLVPVPYQAAGDGTEIPHATVR
jgi:hypothetical protein